jgi:CRISPR-associated protein Cas1
MQQGVMDGLKEWTPEEGTPQGTVISPLLANIYLDPLDHLMEQSGFPMIRYADDFVILCRDQESAELALEDAALWLAGAGLEINFDKTRIVTFHQGLDFLGVHFEARDQWAQDPEAAVWLLPPELRRRAAAGPTDRPAGRAARPAGPAIPAAKAAAAVPVSRPRARPQHAADQEPERRVAYDEAPAPLLRTLYLAEPGVYLRLDGGRLLAMKDGEELLAVPIEKVDQVLAADEGAVSFAVLRELLRRGTGLVVQGHGGEVLGACLPLADSRIELRRLQHRRHEDVGFRLAAARSVVAGKIANGRLLLRRHFRFRPGGQCPVDTSLRELQGQALRAADHEQLLGIEGAAARAYFSSFGALLPEGWQFRGRRRQPPPDPVNALLSYGYGVLFHNLLTLVVERGLDPHLGCLHACRDGHPALVSDLMEEFRALVVDAVVLNLLARAEVTARDFMIGGEGQACRIGVPLRKVFLAALEAKLQSAIEHPLVTGKGDYRRAMRTQVAHWIQVLEGRTPVYRPFLPR